MYKTYKATVEFDVQIKDTGLIVQDPESVGAAVRHHMRTMLPTGWRKNGMLIQIGTVHAEVREGAGVMASYSTKALRTEMANRKWSVGDLAEALGLPRKSTTPYGWLSGGSTPRTEMRSKLAALFANGAASPVVIRKNVKKPTTSNNWFVSDVLSFVINADGTATIKFEATLPVDQALSLLRTLINAGVLMKGEASGE